MGSLTVSLFNSDGTPRTGLIVSASGILTGNQFVMQETKTGSSGIYRSTLIDPGAYEVIADDAATGNTYVVDDGKHEFNYPIIGGRSYLDKSLSETILLSTFGFNDAGLSAALLYANGRCIVFDGDFTLSNTISLSSVDINIDLMGHLFKFNHNNVVTSGNIVVSNGRIDGTTGDAYPYSSFAGATEIMDRIYFPTLNQSQWEGRVAAEKLQLFIQCSAGISAATITAYKDKVKYIGCTFFGTEGSQFTGFGSTAPKDVYGFFDELDSVIENAGLTGWMSVNRSYLHSLVNFYCGGYSIANTTRVFDGIGTGSITALGIKNGIEVFKDESGKPVAARVILPLLQYDCTYVKNHSGSTSGTGIKVWCSNVSKSSSIDDLLAIYSDKSCSYYARIISADFATKRYLEWKYISLFKDYDMRVDLASGGTIISDFISYGDMSLVPDAVTGATIEVYVYLNDGLRFLDVGAFDFLGTFKQNYAA